MFKKKNDFSIDVLTINKIEPIEIEEKKSKKFSVIIHNPDDSLDVLNVIRCCICIFMYFWLNLYCQTFEICSIQNYIIEFEQFVYNSKRKVNS